MKSCAHEQFETLERDHWWFRGRRRVYLELLREALGGAAIERVLDVGAGTGGFLFELERLGDVVHWVEPHADGARRCLARGYPRGVRAIAEDLPYAAMSFDLVALFDVLEHTDDEARVLGEVARVLRPEGLAVISVPAYPWLWSENDETSEHRRRYTRARLRGALEQAGLEVVRCTHANALLLPAIAACLLAGEGLRLVGLHAPSAQRTNLGVRLPAPLGRLCYRLFIAELPFSRRWDLPFGHSILALARRRKGALDPVLGSRSAGRGRARLEGALGGLQVDVPQVGSGRILSRKGEWTLRFRRVPGR